MILSGLTHKEQRVKVVLAIELPKKRRILHCLSKTSEPLRNARRLLRR
jgi:hypothetical protein